MECPKPFNGIKKLPTYNGSYKKVVIAHRIIRFTLFHQN
jgi:hypothetical protein